MAAVSSLGRVSTLRFWFGSCVAWSYDPAAHWRAGVACDRHHRHAEGICQPVAAGPGGPASRSLGRPSVLLPGTAWESAEGDLARWSGRVPIHEAAGTGPLPVAKPG